MDYTEVGTRCGVPDPRWVVSPVLAEGTKTQYASSNAELSSAYSRQG